MQWDNIGGSIPQHKSRAACVKEGTQLWTICCAFIRAVLMFCVCFEVAPNSARFESAAIVFVLGLPISG